MATRGENGAKSSRDLVENSMMESKGLRKGFGNDWGPVNVSAVDGEALQVWAMREEVCSYVVVVAQVDVP